MPIYEYRCQHCSTRFEAYVQAWGTAVNCPGCDSPDIQKLLSTFAMATANAAPGGEGARGAACCGGGCGCRH